MHLITCVGQRAMAVVFPVKALLENKLLCVAAGETQIVTLLYTHSDKIKSEMTICVDWFRKALPHAAIRCVPFEHVSDLYDARIRDVSDEHNDLYFNVNPGMNWEVAFVSLCLPEKTNCIATDNNRLYLWSISEDTRAAQSFDLPDLGIKAYCEVDAEISLNIEDGINPKLSPQARLALVSSDLYQSFSVAFHNKEKNHQAQLLNNHLVWVKETKGRLYFLVDLCNRPPGDTDFKTLSNRDRYRRIMTMMGVIRYTAAIVADDKLLLVRAATDGVEAITPKDIPSWIQREKAINPKRIMPKDKVHTRHAANSALNKPFGHLKDFIKVKCPGNPPGATSAAADSFPKTAQNSALSVPLHICLGDNSAPTLRAILAGSHRRIMVWYDEQSSRIKALADMIIKSYPDKKITLQKTDHRGSHITDAVSRETEAVCLNVTPGTKMQAVCLCAGARRNGAAPLLVSIAGSSVASLVPPGETVMPCRNLSVDEIIKIQVAPFSEKCFVDGSGELWRWLMDGLVSRELISHKDFFKIRYKDRPAFEGSPTTHAIIRRTDQKEFMIGASDDEEGFWWERAVADALERIYPNQVYRQVVWTYPQTASFMSELDIVFNDGRNICVVSCKTGWNQSDTLDVVSEARARFGRMALCFLAVPFAGKDYSGATINEVKILTPEILSDGVKTKKVVDVFADSFKTYRVKEG